MMKEDFYAFDWHRIFVGDAPLLFLLEIILRTAIMYAYTVFLLRVLGKRGMGQLSTLELAIVIVFGSAVGDPMIYADMPITYGILAITVIALLQIGLEKIINSNKKVELVMEGEPNLVIDNGIIKLENMLGDNLSKEDLFRLLRVKDVEHLGQVSKAFFETTGQLSVIFQPPKKIQPGLSVLPENEIMEDDIISVGWRMKKEAIYACMNCGYSYNFKKKEVVICCPACKEEKWIKANL
jgi:uncharacterized membrane protein YcaP (DUF421 family)